MKRMLKAFSIFSFFMWILYYSSIFLIFIKNKFDINIINIDSIYSKIVPFYNMGILGVAFLSIMGLLYFLAGLQTYNNRTSGYFWFLSISYINIISSILYYIIFSITPDSSAIFLNLILGMIFLYFFFRKETMDNFNISKKLQKKVFQDRKNLYYLSAFLIIAYVIVFVIFFISDGGYFTKTEKSLFPSEKYSDLISRNIGDINIKFPKDLILTHLEIDNGNIDYFNMVSLKQGLFIIFNLDPYTDRLYRKLGKTIGYKDPESFIQDFFYNRAGLINLFIKKIRSDTFKGKYNIAKVSEGNHMLQYKGKGNGKEYNEFHICDNENDRIIAVYFLNTENSKVNESYLYTIMESYYKEYDPEKISIIFEEDIDVFDLSFNTVNRMLINKQDYKALYDYSEAIEISEHNRFNINTIKFLRQCLDIRPDFKKAKKMLDDLEDKI
ncbi:MAG: hypothetical protein C0601_03755 [Candidatus Muiribacterium halophilum]|uniref:Uncharacterized protein n=1 Tax=Muiribacterium halophilum TaxID=2053465 RepID=A0A2N5ZJM9_MUIH1|nr:MAG: hypothetical protein C0601_03755 [Candidatus Muirbacterium halophilum]